MVRFRKTARTRLRRDLARVPKDAKAPLVSASERGENGNVLSEDRFLPLREMRPFGSERAVDTLRRAGQSEQAEARLNQEAREIRKCQSQTELTPHIELPLKILRFYIL